MPNEAYAVSVDLLAPTGRNILSSRLPDRTSAGGSRRSSRVLSLDGNSGMHRLMESAIPGSIGICSPRRLPSPELPRLRTKSGV
jgi:hypothetical protein